MRFYDALQLDPAVLKPKIRGAETVEERRRLQFAMALRSLLIVGFAICCIAPVASMFGPENTPMAVAMFCILLGVRFVDFGYCIKDSMVNLGVAFLLLLVAPVLASLVHPVLAVCIHFCAFFALLIMLSDRPEMGNGGLCGFAYVYLTGNPVTGELFWKRAVLTLVCYLLCGLIFYCKHRKKHGKTRFRQVVDNFQMSCEKSRWQLRMALGVSLVLTLGSYFQMERFMWAGFACASLLSSYPYSVDIKERFFQRIIGVVAGSLAFLMIYQVVPDSLHMLLGPFGGICLGFCTDYRYKTAINCFGALMMAAGLYGIEGAVILRIADNVLGAIFGFAVIFLYAKLVDRRFEGDTANMEEPTV